LYYGKIGASGNEQSYAEAGCNAEKLHKRLLTAKHPKSKCLTNCLRQYARRQKRKE
jgi:hypothetical protein